MRTIRTSAIAAAAFAAGVAAACAAHADPPGAHWLRLAAPAGVERAEALALEAGTQRLAAGGERGVVWGPLGGPLERVLSRGPVRDLAFAPDGALFAATDDGLYRIEGPGRASQEQLGAGEASRAIHDLDIAGGRIAAASDAGVWTAAATGGPETRVWRRVDGLPFGPALRAIFASDGGIWAVIEGALWQADPQGRAARVALSGAYDGEEGPVDLARGPAGSLVVLLPRSLALRDAAGQWRTERLVLAPGAAPLRIAAEPGRLWLASDAGLFTASEPAGPWHRAGPPAGHVAVAALTGSGSRLVVATAHGLLRAANSPDASAAVEPAPAPPPPPAPRPDPPVRAVQRQALRYLELEPAHMQALARGAAHRGWLPQLSVRLDAGTGRDRGRDLDSTFTSGEYHQLVDRNRGSDEDYAASLVLSWDLADAAFDLGSIDVSRETRLVAQLRDDVLDEVTQLYFERQRVLAAFAAPPPDSSLALLRLRADELSSGLDAWTGGWFSTQLAPDAVHGPASPAQETSR